MEVDGIAEPVAVAEAAGPLLYALNNGGHPGPPPDPGRSPVVVDQRSTAAITRPLDSVRGLNRLAPPPAPWVGSLRRGELLRLTVRLAERLTERWTLPP